MEKWFLIKNGEIVKELSYRAIKDNASDDEMLDYRLKMIKFIVESCGFNESEGEWNIGSFRVFRDDVEYIITQNLNPEDTN